VPQSNLQRNPVNTTLGLGYFRAGTKASKCVRGESFFREGRGF
jgi:hypothetical protein